MSDTRPLDAHLRPAFDEEQIAATWQRIADAGDKRARRRRQWRFAAIPVLTLGAAVAIMLVLHNPSEEPSALATLDREISIDPGIEVAAVERRAIAFDDGSRITLAPQTKIQVLSNDGRRFSTKLVRGTADYAVRPGGSRKWEIETALATVEVVGTEFRVVHDDHSMTVSVTRGVVVVRGERVRGRVQRLAAGERLVVTEPSTAQREPSTPTAPKPAVAESTDPTNKVAPPPIEPAHEQVKPLERTPTRRVDPRQAKQTKQTIAEVLAEADRLRARDPSSAATLIERALASHPNDSSSGVAAFVLGRLYLESLGQFGKAAAVFRTIAERGSPHGLVEDARARLVEALVKHGDLVGARNALAEYERWHPKGRWLPTLRKLLSVP